MNVPFACALSLSLAVFAQVGDVRSFNVPSGIPVGTRIRWEVPFRADLSACDGFEFDFRCSSLSQTGRGFMVYVFCGDRGCYDARFPVARVGEWTHVTVRKRMVSDSERFPQGWSDVRCIKVSAVTDGTGAFDGAVRNVRALPPPLSAAAVLYCDKPQDGQASRKPLSMNRNLMDALGRIGAPAYLLSDRDIARNGMPGNARLLFAAGNSNPPADATESLRRYLQNGGVVALWAGMATRLFKNLARDFPSRVLALDFPAGAWDDIPEDRLKKFLLGHLEGCADVLARRTDERSAAARAMEAEIAAMPSVPGELRTIYCHTPWGGSGTGTNWENTARLVSSCGFNQVSANFCCGMYAGYASRLLLPWRTPEGEWRDALEEAKTACRRHGLSLIAWRCCWTTPPGLTTKEEIGVRRNAGRLAKRLDGGEHSGFGCPTHPENIRIEVESLVELAKKGVDGIDLDYMRYASEDTCFCDRCRSLFEKAVGRAVANWPQAVRKDTVLAAAWNDFRSDNISRVVENVSARVRAEAPGVKIHVCGFSVPAVARMTTGQDWPHWCRRGWVDVVRPMDYCSETAELDSLIRVQRQMDIGRAKMYPLVGPSCWPDTDGFALSAARHIQTVRAAGFRGFGVFALDRRTAKMFPLLATGPMRRYRETQPQSSIQRAR